MISMTNISNKAVTTATDTAVSTHRQSIAAPVKPVQYTPAYVLATYQTQAKAGRLNTYNRASGQPIRIRLNSAKAILSVISTDFKKCYLPLCNDQIRSSILHPADKPMVKYRYNQFITFLTKEYANGLYLLPDSTTHFIKEGKLVQTAEAIIKTMQDSNYAKHTINQYIIYLNRILHLLQAHNLTTEEEIINHFLPLTQYINKTKNEKTAQQKKVMINKLFTALGYDKAKAKVTAVKTIKGTTRGAKPMLVSEYQRRLTDATGLERALLLLYGMGALRISELRQTTLTAKGLRVLGKGNQIREVSIAKEYLTQITPYLAQAKGLSNYQIRKTLRIGKIHSLRKMSAGLVLEIGGIEMAREHLGHKKIETTMIYIGEQTKASYQERGAIQLNNIGYNEPVNYNRL